MFKLLTRLGKQPLASLVKLDTPIVSTSDYLSAAVKAGLSDSQQISLRISLDRQDTDTKLQHFLSENGIAVFPYNRVAAYMEKLRYRSGGRWRWVSLLAYNNAIPQEVLWTIGKIRESLPHVYFYISEFERDPDPFLAVSVYPLPQITNTNTYVIERWDEPGFRM